jgi:hypothetical protein
MSFGASVRAVLEPVLSRAIRWSGGSIAKFGEASSSTDSYPGFCSESRRLVMPGRLKPPSLPVVTDVPDARCRTVTPSSGPAAGSRTRPASTNVPGGVTTTDRDPNRDCPASPYVAFTDARPRASAVSIPDASTDATVDGMTLQRAAAVTSRLVPLE